MLAMLRTGSRASPTPSALFRSLHLLLGHSLAAGQPASPRTLPSLASPPPSTEQQPRGSRRSRANPSHAPALPPHWMQNLPPWPAPQGPWCHLTADLENKNTESGWQPLWHEEPGSERTPGPQHGVTPWTPTRSHSLDPNTESPPGPSRGLYYRAAFLFFGLEGENEAFCKTSLEEKYVPPPEPRQINK